MKYLPPNWKMLLLIAGLSVGFIKKMPFFFDDIKLLP